MVARPGHSGSTATRKSRQRPERPHRTPVETTELSLIRMGRFVILFSVLVAALEAEHFGFPMFALLMVALYIGYLAFWWSAFQTRRLEALALATIAIALAALYIDAQPPLWVTGSEIGADIKPWQR